MSPRSVTKQSGVLNGGRWCYHQSFPGGSWQAVGLTEEGYRSTFFIKGVVNGTRQSVGADISRPKGRGIELSVE